MKLSATPTSLEDGQEITLSADAKGGQGSLKVEFFKGTEKVGEIASAPYELKLSITSNEDATLSFTAKAVASDSQSAVSEAVNVQVKVDKEAPEVSVEASSANLNAAGAVTLTANASDNKGVVKVEFFKGTDRLGEDITPADGFSFVVNLSAEDNGFLKYSAKAYDKKGNVGTSVEVTVLVDIDVTNPNITLSATKTTVNDAGSITFTADASDNTGIAKVEFFEGNSRLGEDTQVPYTFEINHSAANNGNHTYTAKAFDGKGNMATSEPLTILVDIDAIPPTVSLQSDKISITKAGSAILTAEVSDNKGVTKVEFYDGDAKLGEDTEVPFTFKLDFTAANNGPKAYTAKAFDAKGNNTSSTPVTINVDIDVTLPVVKLKSDKSNITAAGSVTLNAEATDDKSVTKVEFFEGSDKLSEDTEAPYGHVLTFPFDETLNGPHSYTAKVTDSSGNVAVSELLTITIDIDATAPTASLSSNPTSLSAVGSLTLSADVTDNKGVVKVEFYRIQNGGNPTLLGTDTIASDGFKQAVNYSADYKATDSFRAKAFDAIGNSKTSDALDVNIDIDITNPTVSLTTDKTSLSAVGSVTLTAMPTDNRGIDKVEFYRNGSKVGEDADGSDGFEQVVDYNATYVASDSFSAKAFDLVGNNATSSAVVVAVDIDITPPTASLTASPSTLNAAGSVTLQASVSDNKEVTKVEFYKNGFKLGEDTTPADNFSYSVTYNADYKATDNFSAKAFDASGNATMSVAQGVEVYIDTIAPTVSLSTPSSNVNFEATFTANASDVNSIAKVEFYEGATMLFTDSDGSNGFSYTANYTKANNGNHTYTAKAFDPKGNFKESSPVSVTVKVIELSKMSAGTYHTCALGSDGKTYCWGDNSYGQLGNGGTTASTTPVAVSTPTGISFTQLAGGGWHTCALTSDGKAYCWGGNWFGFLGNGGTTQSNTPSAVQMPLGVGFSQLVSNGLHTCALGSDSNAYCWGQGNNGQLGNGTTNSSTTPVAVTLPAGVAFSVLGVGSFHTCAVGSDNKAYCWGQGQYGVLGNGTTTNSSLPSAVAMPSGVTFTTLSMGSTHTCAVGSDNKSYCWGYNGVGELGNGTTSNSSAPVAVSMPSGVSFVGLALGGEHSCALGSDNQAYCWGWNVFGQLGIGSGVSRSTTPVVVALPSGVSLSQLTAGYTHTCGLGSNGRSYCWGENAKGQLGDGTTSNRNAPTPVAHP